MSGELVVPVLDPELDTLGAGLEYTAGGLYVGPMLPGTKHPGSVLGTGWHTQTTRDQRQLVEWFAGRNLGLFVHLGRSGAIALDVDHPDRMPDVMRQAIGDLRPPYQSTRPGCPERGHYLFAVPPDRMFGNGTGGLGTGWGDVRGRNGIIVVWPTPHSAGGCYRWERVGPVPMLPESIASLLPHSGEVVDAATDVEVEAFLIAHVGTRQPGLLRPITNRFTAAVNDGGSRHKAALDAACWVAREAAAGFFPALDAFGAVRSLFVERMGNGGPDARFRDEHAAGVEFAGIVAWAIAQAKAVDPAKTRAGVEQRCVINDEFDALVSGLSDVGPDGGGGDDEGGDDDGGRGGGGGGDDGDDGDDDGDKKRPSAATQLVNLAKGRYRFALEVDGSPFAVPLTGPRVAQPLRGKNGVRQQLARVFFELTGRAASQQALADAVAVLEGTAAQSSREKFPLRVAQVGDTLYLDLGRPDGLTVKITADGWEKTTSPPVVWRRTELTGELPDVTPGEGDIGAFRELVNVSDEYWPLILAWLVAALFPAIPHPVLYIHGEHGVAKSTATKLTAGLIDPSPAATRAAPRDVDTWVIAAAGSWTVPLDNLSTIPDWLSDAICRAVTGDGLVRRALYSDGDLSVISFRRAIVLNTIDAGALRGDLADRLLAVELALIPDGERQSENALARLWERARPIALAGLLDITARVLRALPTVDLDEKPRMADFAEIVDAVDKVMGTHALKTYLSQRANLAEDVISSDAVGQAVQQFVESLGSGTWEGTYAELLAALDHRRGDEKAPRGWPKSARALSGRVARLAPALRTVKIGVERPPRTSDARTVTLKSERGPQTSSPPSPPSETAPDLGKPGDGCNDGSDGTKSTVIQTVMALTCGNDARDGSDGLSGLLSVADEDAYIDDYIDEDDYGDSELDFDIEAGAE